MHGILLEGNGKGNDVVIIVPDLKVHNIKSAIVNYLGVEEDDIVVDMLKRTWYSSDKKKKYEEKKKEYDEHIKKLEEERNSDPYQKMKGELIDYIDSRIGKGSSGYSGITLTKSDDKITKEYVESSHFVNDIKIVTVKYLTDSVYGLYSSYNNTVLTIDDTNRESVRKACRDFLGLSLREYYFSMDSGNINIKPFEYGNTYQFNLVNISRFGVNI